VRYRIASVGTWVLTAIIALVIAGGVVAVNLRQPVTSPVAAKAAPSSTIAPTTQPPATVNVPTAPVATTSTPHIVIIHHNIGFHDDGSGDGTTTSFPGPTSTTTQPVTTTTGGTTTTTGVTTTTWFDN